jgi:hypothetical protein
MTRELIVPEDPKKLCCANCIFSRESNDPRLLECHQSADLIRHAAVPVPGLGPNEVRFNFHFQWPIHLKTDWCGDYKPL